MERYITAPPIRDMVDLVNAMYDAGHHIVIYTARGQLSCGGDIQKIEEKYRTISEYWLDANSVKYHELRFGKMYYDYLIDDKAWNVNAVEEIRHLVEQA